MTLEVNHEYEDEEITMILDDSTVLKAGLGSRGEIVWSATFTKLSNDNYALYGVLRKFVKDLFHLADSE